jgi:hypothetical protein
MFLTVLRIRIQDPVPSWPLDPDLGSKIGFSGSRIPYPYFRELCDKFLGKKFYNSLKLAKIFFFSISKINFEKFVATKKGTVWQKSFSPLSFVAVFGSEILDG